MRASGSERAWRAERGLGPPRARQQGVRGTKSPGEYGLPSGRCRHRCGERSRPPHPASCPRDVHPGRPLRDRIVRRSLPAQCVPVARPRAGLERRRRRHQAATGFHDRRPYDDRPRPCQSLRERHSGPGCGAAFLSRLPCHRKAGPGGSRSNRAGARRCMPREWVRAPRWRNSRNARLLSRR